MNFIKTSFFCLIFLLDVFMAGTMYYGAGLLRDRQSFQRCSHPYTNAKSVRIRTGSESNESPRTPFEANFRQLATFLFFCLKLPDNDTKLLEDRYKKFKA